MKKLKLHITILCLLIWSFSFAQQYTNYYTKDGLPSNHVYTIVQDAKGFIWFLTDKGLTRFNGNQFKTFTTKDGLPNNDIWEAFPTPDGKVWFMSKAPELGYIDKDSVHSFPNNNKGEIINPIFTSQVGDSIFPTSTYNSFALKNKKWHPVKVPPLKNSNLFFTKLWHPKIPYLTAEPKIDNVVYHLYDKDLKVKKIFNINDKNRTNGTRGQLNDSLYFFNSRNQYSIINLNTLKIKTIYLKDAFGNNFKTHPRINLVNNELQISTETFVAKLDKNLEVIDPFYFPKELKAHFGFIDKSNTIWLTTFNNGVYKLPYVKRNVIYKFQNEKIQSFNVINNKLMIGVYKKGFYRYDTTTNSFSKKISANDFIYGVSEIKPLKTNFYSSTNKLVKEVNGKLTNLDFSITYGNFLSSNEIARKQVYYNNNLYGNFSFGLHRFNIEPFSKEKEYLQKGCNDIIIFKNHLLFATNVGLKELKNDTIQPVTFSNNNFNKPILNLKVIDKNTLLINTDGFGSYTTNLQTINTIEDTAFLIVKEAFVEKKTLWLATNNGVLQLVKNNNKYQLKNTLTIKDGLLSNQINTVYVDAKNIIIGTNNGLSILPKEKDKQSEFLDLYIEKATYNNAIISDKNIRFKYKNNNSLNFKIASIDFSENHPDLKYQYKLKPLQKNWITTTSKNINFNSLSPNNYLLEVKANNINKQLQFIIKPLWWQTSWFKIIFSIISFLGLFLLYKWNQKRIEKRERAKIQMQQKIAENKLYALRSQMNPHFVFNSLNAIQYYITKNDIELSEKYLVKFSRLIRMFFDFSEEKQITIQQEIELLKGYLEIEKMRFGGGFNFNFIKDKHLKLSTKIPTMLLQPIVENAVNHGVFHNNRQGNILILFNYLDANTFNVSVKDDGVGIAKAKEIQAKSIKKHTSKSTKIIADRIELLNQSELWQITQQILDLSTKGKSGTEVIITFKKLK